MICVHIESKERHMPTWTHTITSAATPEAIWPYYADVTIWPVWDAGLQHVTLDGPFVAGSRGTLVVEGQPPLTYELLEVDEGRSFSDLTDIPGVVRLVFHHTLEAITGGTRITPVVVAEGPQAEAMLPMVTSDTPEAMESLARLAETAQATA
jgi:Polyketide cyclase / dehydrase and lipid transport